MSILTRTVPSTTQEITGFRCDRCGHEHAVNDLALKAQEYLHIRRVGGYGSRFGDGAEIRLDICDECQWHLFASYLKDEADNAEGQQDG